MALWDPKTVKFEKRKARRAKKSFAECARTLPKR